jgi:hypothetical protein
LGKYVSFVARYQLHNQWNKKSIVIINPIDIRTVPIDK